MSVRPIRAIDRSDPPLRSIPQPERTTTSRMVLTPIPWGKRDWLLAKGVCERIVDATGPMVIPFQPLTHRRTRAFLSSHGVHC